MSPRFSTFSPDLTPGPAEICLQPETVVSMFHKFMVFPVTTRETLLRLIDREIQKSTPKIPGRIIAKLNALVDTDIIANYMRPRWPVSVSIFLLEVFVVCVRAYRGLAKTSALPVFSTDSWNIRESTIFTMEESRKFTPAVPIGCRATSSSALKSSIRSRIPS